MERELKEIEILEKRFKRKDKTEGEGGKTKARQSSIIATHLDYDGNGTLLEGGKVAVKHCSNAPQQR